jgi:hypothetical protein
VVIYHNVIYLKIFRRNIIMNHIFEKLITTFIILTLFFGLVAGSAFGVAISDIRVSNYSSSSVTISWITDTVTDGSVKYGPSEGPLGNTHGDDRGSITDDTHYATITGLAPETAYDYQVVSGGVSSSTGSFTTTKVGTGNTYIIYSYVYKQDGTTPAEGAIVYVTVTHSGTTSYYLSKLASSNGYWQLDLGNLKSPSTKDVLSYSTGDVISVFSQGAADGTGSADDIVSGSSPQRISHDISLPVFLSVFTASATPNGVLLSWRTESEVDNIGWNIYQSTKQDGEYHRINDKLIPGAGNSAMPNTYQFLDKEAKEGVTYFYYLEDIDIFGEKNRSDVIQVPSDQSWVEKPPLEKHEPLKSLPPSKNALLQNYPNPFNAETWIPYQLARESGVEIKIFNVAGQLVKTLELGHREAGYYLRKEQSAHWDGRNNLGESVASGVYFYTINAGNFAATRRLVILK